MSSFIRLKVGQVCDIRRGASPRPIDEWMSDKGIPWVKISDATKKDTRYIDFTEGFIKPEGARYSVCVAPGDLIISNSATPALPKIMRINACIHDGWLLASNFKSVTRDYLYYQIKYLQKYLINQGNGSIFKNLKTEILADFPITIPSDLNNNPDIIIQGKIVNVLSKIEDKIDNNIEITISLESLAKTLYDYWFLQFEFPNEEGKPYKSSGGKMVWNEELKRDIPEGWEVKNIKQHCNITWGQCPEGKNILPLEYNGDDAILYCSGAGDMRNGLLVDCQAKTNASRRYAHENDILMSVAGSIGALCIADRMISLGRAAVSITPKKGEELFIYQTVNVFLDRMKTVSSGSIQKVINDGHLNDVNFAYSIQTVNMFKQYNSILRTEILLNKENQELISLRDFLLPLLMNGQVTFK